MSKYILCEVRDSPIHGKGVFATANIKKGMRICIWDGDLVPINSTDEKDLLYDFTLIVRNNANDYLKFIGYKEPKSLVGVGQYINDSSSFIPSTGQNTVLEQIIIYELRSTRNANVMYKCMGKKCIVVAIKDITKDEELFHKYGYKFWLHRNSPQNKLEPEERIMVQAICMQVNNFVMEQPHIVEEFRKLEKSPLSEVEKNYELELLRTDLLCHFLSENRNRLYVKKNGNMYTVICGDAQQHTAEEKNSGKTEEDFINDYSEELENHEVPPACDIRPSVPTTEPKEIELSKEVVIYDNINEHPEGKEIFDIEECEEECAEERADDPNTKDVNVRELFHNLQRVKNIKPINN